MKTVELSQGYVALVDDEDFDRINQFKWCVLSQKNTLYAKRTDRAAGSERIVYLHRFILNLPPYRPLVDHRDGNGLNCQKYNLRVATSTQNHCNSQKRSNRTSKYKGVSWFSRDGIWVAQIKMHNRSKYLGRFSDETEAARAYDKAALELFGEFARINFPETQ